MHLQLSAQIATAYSNTDLMTRMYLMKAGLGNLWKVMVLIVVPHVVCEGIQGPVVRVCLLTLQITEGHYQHLLNHG